MSKYGLLIDLEWCTGCHTCEIACQVEHSFPEGQTGIKLAHIGPWEISEDKWQDTFIPVPTNQCDTCVSRRGLGKPPTCVQHCQAKCMSFGSMEELNERMASRPKQMLFSL